MASVQAQLLSGSHPQGSAVVCISQGEYDGLLKIARQYACLQQNLLRGGVNEATLAILSNNDSLLATTRDSPTSYGNNPHGQLTDPSNLQGEDFFGATSSRYLNNTILRYRHETVWNGSEPLFENAPVSTDISDGGVPIMDSSTTTTLPSDPQLDRDAMRTIQLVGLPSGVAHSDITSAVRGGQLLDIYLRAGKRTANVSFVFGEDAKAFYSRARQNSLYIKNKKVELKWAERQYILPGHVAHKLRYGASRNLVIHNYDPNHTEKTIREDLEHIHNLVVINIDFLGADCYIQTNSVHNAIFAQTCMMSRMKYRGQRIGWARDECKQPFGEAPTLKPNRLSISVKKVSPSRTLSNRFELLGLKCEEEFSDNDGSGDGSEDSDPAPHSPIDLVDGMTVHA